MTLSILSWGATVFSLAGIVLNAKKIIWCWPVWMGSNVLWGTYYISTQQPAPLTLILICVFGNIYGWRSWKKS